MPPLREWLRPPKALLLLLFLLIFASVSTLAIFGWRLLEQERMVEAQRSQDRLEHAADRLAATLREALAKCRERVAAGVVSPGDVLFTLSATSLNAAPPGQLLYYPSSPADPEPPGDKIFAEPELFEFVESQPSEALRDFERLTHSADASVRAGALLRMARILRNLGRRPESVAVYRRLADLDENVAGLPASLLAALAICELARDPAAAQVLHSDLSSGRWRLTAGQFEFYWSEAARISRNSEPPPAEKSRFTQIAEFVWKDRLNHPEARGYATEWIGGAPVLLMWSGAPEHRRVLAARPASLMQGVPATADIRYAFVDAKGYTLAGVKDGASHAVVRTAAESELPWTLFVSENQPAGKNAFSAQQRFLLVGLSVMMLFLVLGTYFIALAIQREAAVQRMQSNFVSAVSHEFRSPLTSMRQLSEMLALGRVSSEERRQLYYETLVKETSRLQRLIEGLLHFGRMEAGARRYRFEEYDAAAIVESVVCEFTSQIAAGKHIEAVKANDPLWIEADFDAMCVALRNLLDNAIKYSPDQPTVWIECGREQERIAIRVRDEGLGITDAERRIIFKKFMRGSAAVAANVKGSGVGLAMVSHIVAAHGGEVTVASVPGRGSLFTMLLPAAERA